MAESTASQLDEIEAGTADRSAKDQAKLLLLTQVAVAGGLTALSLKGTVGSLGKGRTLVLGPGPQGVPVVSAALTADTIIIDSNTAIALRKRATDPKSLQPGEQALLKRFDALKALDVRIADVSIGEAAAHGRPPPQQGFAVGGDRAGGAYTGLLDELQKANVGGGKGAADRQIVADAFFAVTEKGVTPSFATMDPGIYNKLYSMKIAAEGGTALNKLGKSLPEAMPNGFDVTVNGRVLHVLPMPKR